MFSAARLHVFVYLAIGVSVHAAPAGAPAVELSARFPHDSAYDYAHDYAYYADDYSNSTVHNATDDNSNYNFFGSGGVFGPDGLPGTADDQEPDFSNKRQFDFGSLPDTGANVNVGDLADLGLDVDPSSITHGVTDNVDNTLSGLGGPHNADVSVGADINQRDLLSGLSLDNILKSNDPSSVVLDFDDLLGSLDSSANVDASVVKRALVDNLAGKLGSSGDAAASTAISATLGGHDLGSNAVADAAVDSSIDKRQGLENILSKLGNAGLGLDGLSNLGNFGLDGDASASTDASTDSSSLSTSGSSSNVLSGLGGLNSLSDSSTFGLDTALDRREILNLNEILSRIGFFNTGALVSASVSATASSATASATATDATLSVPSASVTAGATVTGTANANGFDLNTLLSQLGRNGGGLGGNLGANANAGAGGNFGGLDLSQFGLN